MKNGFKVVLIMGIPGSGKSTLCDLFCDTNTFTRIRSDELLTQKKCLEEFEKAVRSGKRVVVDQANLTRKSRQQWISNAQRLGVCKEEIVIIWLRVEPEVCITRVTRRLPKFSRSSNLTIATPRKVVSKVIKSYVGKTQKPLEMEGAKVFEINWKDDEPLRTQLPFNVNELTNCKLCYSCPNCWRKVSKILQNFLIALAVLLTVALIGSWYILPNSGIGNLFGVDDSLIVITIFSILIGGIGINMLIRMLSGQKQEINSEEEGESKNGKSGKEKKKEEGKDDEGEDGGEDNEGEKNENEIKIEKKEKVKTTTQIEKGAFITSVVEMISQIDPKMRKPYNYKFAVSKYEQGWAQYDHDQIYNMIKDELFKEKQKLATKAVNNGDNIHKPCMHLNNNNQNNGDNKASSFSSSSSRKVSGCVHHNSCFECAARNQLSCHDCRFLCGDSETVHEAITSLKPSVIFLDFDHTLFHDGSFQPYLIEVIRTHPNVHIVTRNREIETIQNQLLHLGVPEIDIHIVGVGNLKGDVVCHPLLISEDDVVLFVDDTPREFDRIIQQSEKVTFICFNFQCRAPNVKKQ